MTLRNDTFPSSAAFDVIQSSLAANEADRADAIKKGNCVFGFTLKNDAGETESWHIDLKHKGAVGKGVAPEGGKADVTLILADQDFGKLVLGKENAQRMFMAGKMKIRGDVMKATRLEPILKKAQSQSKL
jgi:putative sterol carrier protein